MFYGCYSFSGGSVPPHLKTVSIASVLDNSNFGTPQYRELATRSLIEKFRNDNSMTLVDRDGDARVAATITEIREEPINVKAGEVERERKIRVTLDTEYYDAVKKKQVFKKSFSNSAVFTVLNAGLERDKAIRTALAQNIDDILIAVVSGW
jgi:hypothetical protein